MNRVTMYVSGGRLGELFRDYSHILSYGFHVSEFVAAFA